MKLAACSFADMPQDSLNFLNVVGKNVDACMCVIYVMSARLPEQLNIRGSYLMSQTNAT